MTRLDPRLDWIPRFDPKSLQYPIRSSLGSVLERPRSWKTGAVLDQGQEGACVGFGWTAELLASPKPDYLTPSDIANGYARGVYHEAQTIDEWPGEQYDGTSVLAGAKAIRSRGFVGEYRWCLSIEDVRDAVIAEGPVVIGIPWLEDMYYTRPSGLVDVGGPEVGGHCLLLTGYHPSMRIPGEDYHDRFRVFKWRNSWSEDYGINGSGYVRYEDLRDLLRGMSGEACCPVNRQRVRLSAS